MEHKVTVKKINFSHVSVRSLTNFVSCLLAFFPCIFSNFNGTIGPTGILIIYMASILLAVYSTNPGSTIKIDTGILKPLILWGIVFLICIFNNNGDIQRSSFNPILHFLFILVFAFLFASKNELFLRNIFRVLILYLCIHLILGFYFLVSPDTLLRFGTRWFSLNNPVMYEKFFRYVGQGAFMGLSSHYSTSGMYMALAVVLFASFLLVYKSITSKWSIFYLILFVAAFVALVLTQKRGHLLFSAAAIILMYIVGFIKGNISRKARQLLILILILVVAVILLLRVPAFQNMLTRFIEADSLDEVSTGRVSNLWLPAWQEFKEHPIFGMGWRQFRYAHPMYSGTVNNDAHNIYLQFLAENGVVGGGYIIVLMVYTYISTWRLLIKSKYNGTRDEYLNIMFSFGYQTFFILYGFTGNPFYDIPCMFPYIICCSITYSYQYKYKNLIVIRGKKPVSRRRWIW